MSAPREGAARGVSGQPPHQAHVWFPYAPLAAAPAGPSRARVASGAGVQAAVGAIGGAALLRGGSPHAAWLVWAVAAATLALAVASPHGAYAALQRALRAGSSLAGRAALWVVMPVVFFAVVVPLGLIFRRGRRDPLRRSFDRGATSYFSPPRQAGPAERIY